MALNSSEMRHLSYQMKIWIVFEMIMVALLVEVQGTANRGPLCGASRTPGGQKKT